MPLQCKLFCNWCIIMLSNNSLYRMVQGYGSNFYSPKKFDHSHGHTFISANGDLFIHPTAHAEFTYLTLMMNTPFTSRKLDSNKYYCPDGGRDHTTISHLSLYQLYFMELFLVAFRILYPTLNLLVLCRLRLKALNRPS